MSNFYQIDKSIFYSLCLQANKICAINYDTITLIDLLGFVSLHCKDMYINISINKREESRIKAKNMAQRMSRGRIR